jgi:hypothetical protein
LSFPFSLHIAHFLFSFWWFWANGDAEMKKKTPQKKKKKTKKKKTEGYRTFSEISAKLPRERYEFPQTSAQEYGWDTKLLVRFPRPLASIPRFGKTVSLNHTPFFFFGGGVW